MNHWIPPRLIRRLLRSSSRPPALVGLGLASLLVGCGDGRTTAEKKAAEGYLIVNNMAEPSGLDPQTVTGLSESHIIGALFEGLVNYDPQDLHPVPGIAESWTMSADGKTWTFRLRQAAKWSNGDPITAADFLFSYERMLRPGFGAEYASMLHGIRGDGTLEFDLAIRGPRGGSAATAAPGARGART